MSFNSFRLLRFKFLEDKNILNFLEIATSEFSLITNEDKFLINSFNSLFG